MIHKAVLVNEVLEYLDPKPGEIIVDCTVGQAGHTLEILKKIAPTGKVIGIDADAEQIEHVKEHTKRFQERVILEHDSYANIKSILQKHGIEKVQGILLDLGFSSWQLEDAGRGFSFLKDEPLDMQYGKARGISAAEIINQWPEEELRRIFEEYGEEKFARKIAKKITEERRRKEFTTTFELKQLIESVVPRREKIHPATRVFQALRIAANRELENLKIVLPQAVEVLAPKGRLVVISFHSLEDRIAKQFFQETRGIEILTKKPIEASAQEVAENPRSRSAKLRAIEKI